MKQVGVMNNHLLETHATGLRHALADHDQQSVREHRDWLTGAVAAALLDQDVKAMQALRAALVELIPLADKYISSGAGERWRALGEVLQSCADTYKPLEQRRLAEPSRLSGLILRRIAKESGITPSVLAARLNKKRSHISNELNALEKEGLIYRLSEGRNIYLYISGTGRGVLASFLPVRSLDDTGTEKYLPREYPHVDPERLRHASPDLSGLVHPVA